MGTEHKSTEELKEELDELSARLKVGKNVKKTIQRELKKKENEAIHDESSEEGLGGLLESDGETDKPVWIKKKGDRPGLNREDLNIPSRKDPGVSIEKEKGLNEILDE